MLVLEFIPDTNIISLLNQNMSNVICLTANYMPGCFAKLMLLICCFDKGFLQMFGDDCSNQEHWEANAILPDLRTAKFAN
jgi:hypothetical protein